MQNISIKRRFMLGGVSVLSLIATAGFSMTGAMAQDSEATEVEEGGLETITVTANRREENIQDVAVSASVLSGERFNALFAAGEDIRALATRIPSLYAESSNGRVAPRFYIRGLGNTDFDLAASQPVSVIMDEVVMENVILKSFPLFDIERVEVLRGPQGTLFGRNTPAGVVKFESRKPTHEFDAYGTVSYGTFDTVTAEGALGGSLIKDTLAGRVSFLVQRRRDWIDNDFTGQDDVMGGFEEFAFRGQLLWTPSDNFSALANVHTRSLEGTASVFRANILSTGSNELNENFERDTVFFDEGDDNPQNYDSFGTSLKLDYDYGGAVLTSITAWETTEGSSLGDIDGGNLGGPGIIPFPSQTEDGIDDLDQITQEIRLASDPSMPFRWQVGGYFFHSDFQITTRPFFVDPTTVEHTNTAWALFGQVEYDITDRWTLTAGGRYTDDEKEFAVLALGWQNPGAPIPLSTFDRDVQDDQFTWDISATYAVTDDVNVYGRVATGFRAPTIQGRDVAFFGAPTTADSETVTSIEAGFKSELLNNTLRLNGAAFWYEIEDQQFTAIGGGGNLIQLVNAERGVGWGLEFDAEWLATENLVFTAGFSYNNTEIDDADLSVGNCQATLPDFLRQCTVLDRTDVVVNPAGDNLNIAFIDGNPFPQAPDIIASVTMRYAVPLGDHGELFFFTDWAYQGETNFFLYESKEYSSDGNFEGGLRIGYADNSGAWEAAMFARNITDEENLKGGIDFNNLTGFVNEPRIIGASFSFKLN